jgi:hypothetical protein
MANYSILVKDKSGNTIGSVVQWFSLDFSKNLNSYGSMTITIPTSCPNLRSLIALRTYEFYVYRNDVLVWAGEQASAHTSLMGQRNILTVTSFSFLEMLNHRITGAIKSFSNTDAGDIAWELIDDSQNETDGDFGITQGSIETTVDRDRTFNDKNIMEALVQLSEVNNGFDFEITDSKVFNVYSPKRS